MKASSIAPLFRGFAAALALASTASAHRSLPSGITCGPQFASPDSPLVIPNPEISWANYAIHTCDYPIAWYEAAGAKDQEFKFTITIPVIERFKDVRMSTVIIGEGLPLLNDTDSDNANVPPAILQYMSDNSLGGVVFNSPADQSTCDHLSSMEMIQETSIVDERCHFYEPFGGSNLWVILDEVYKLPATLTGTTNYKIAVYEQYSSTAKASFACCDFTENFVTQYDIPDSTCDICGTQASSNSAWSALFFEHKSMAQYGGYPPLQNCAVNQFPIDDPMGDQCPPATSENNNEATSQTESCALGCSKNGECHSHNVFGQCTHELEWSLTPKFGDAKVSKVIIHKGDKIKFTAPAYQLAHNLFELKDEASLQQCSFESASNLAGVEEINIGHEVVFDEVGTFYFACAIASHCTMGQKMIVEVKDATDGLRCHTHDDERVNVNVSLPLNCQDGQVNVRVVDDEMYGATSKDFCSEQCVPTMVFIYMPGFEKGSCADVGFIHNPTEMTVTPPGSPAPINVVVASNTISTCHCHSYEKISCAENDNLYAEHIADIEEFCTGILDGSDDACPYKCFQPVEVLHLHYLECPDRAKDSTYVEIEATNKCHIAATASSGNKDFCQMLNGNKDDEAASSANLPSAVIGIAISLLATVSFVYA